MLAISAQTSLAHATQTLSLSQTTVTTATQSYATVTLTTNLIETANSNVTRI